MQIFIWQKSQFVEWEAKWAGREQNGGKSSAILLLLLLQFCLSV